MYLRACEQQDKSTDEQKGLKVEMESLKQCLEVCAQASETTDHARVNEFQDVSAGDDSQQIIVSTIGDLISAQRVTAGARSAQWCGQMSDISIQQISRDRNQGTVGLTTEPKAMTDAPFAARRGAGRNLKE